MLDASSGTSSAVVVAVVVIAVVVVAPPSVVAARLHAGATSVAARIIGKISAIARDAVTAEPFAASDTASLPAPS